MGISWSPRAAALSWPAGARAWAQHFFYLMPHIFFPSQADDVASGHADNAGPTEHTEDDPEPAATDAAVPKTPVKAEPSAKDPVYRDLTPPKLTPAARRSVSAGLVRDRPSSGASIPLQGGPRKERDSGEEDAAAPSQPAQTKVKSEPLDHSPQAQQSQRMHKQKSAQKRSEQLKQQRAGQRTADKKLQAARVHLATLQVACNVWNSQHSKRATPQRRHVLS